MKMVVPDGKKVAELRRAKGFVQKELAHRVGISERVLRDVETRSKPLPEFKLVNLATQLGVEFAQLRGRDHETHSQLSVPAISASPGDPHQLQLRAITAGGELWR